MICSCVARRPKKIAFEYQTLKFNDTHSVRSYLDFPPLWRRVNVRTTEMGSCAGQRPCVNRWGVWCIWNEVTFSLSSADVGVWALSAFFHTEKLSPCTTWPFKAWQITLLQAKSITTSKHNIKWKESEILAWERSHVQPVNGCRFKGVRLRVTESPLIITSGELMECPTALLWYFSQDGVNTLTLSPFWFIKRYSGLNEKQNSLVRSQKVGQCCLQGPLPRSLFKHNGQSVLWRSTFSYPVLTARRAKTNIIKHVEVQFSLILLCCLHTSWTDWLVLIEKSDLFIVGNCLFSIVLGLKKKQIKANSGQPAAGLANETHRDFFKDSTYVLGVLFLLFFLHLIF